jgi:hypothetical protein
VPSFDARLYRKRNRDAFLFESGVKPRDELVRDQKLIDESARAASVVNARCE